MAEWEKGRAWGYQDERNRIASSQGRFHKAAYVLGWRVGNAELSSLIEDAAHPNDCY